MPENNDSIKELRSLLFETIRALKDKDTPMEIARAKTIAEVAQVVINSAKVEVDYMRLRGDRGAGTGFVPALGENPVPGTPAQPRLVRGKAQSGSED